VIVPHSLTSSIETLVFVHVVGAWSDKCSVDCSLKKAATTVSDKIDMFM